MYMHRMWQCSYFMYITYACYTCLAHYVYHVGRYALLLGRYPCNMRVAAHPLVVRLGIKSATQAGNDRFGFIHKGWAEMMYGRQDKRGSLHEERKKKRKRNKE